VNQVSLHLSHIVCTTDSCCHIWAKWDLPLKLKGYTTVSSGFLGYTRSKWLSEISDWMLVYPRH
jgi:hypothetical protein